MTLHAAACAHEAFMSMLMKPSCARPLYRIMHPPPSILKPSGGELGCAPDLALALLWICLRQSCRWWTSAPCAAKLVIYQGLKRFVGLGWNNVFWQVGRFFDCLDEVKLVYSVSFIQLAISDQLFWEYFPYWLYRKF